MKKYHHKPGLGVKSGSVRLCQNSLVSNVYYLTMVASHPKPQVFGIHAQLPDTRVEASTSTIEYTRNSSSIGIVFRKSDEIGAGDARRETGSPTSNINNGTTSNRDGSDS